MKRNTVAKGKRIENLAKEWLEAQGYHVQLCPRQTIWVPDKKQAPTFVGGVAIYPRRAVPVNMDFFGCWDGIAVNEFARFFFQVTIWEHVADKRKDIAACPFLPAIQDRILGYVSGRNRHFKVLNAPEFQWKGECLMPPKDDGTQRKGS